MTPMKLPPTSIEHFYLGGERIAALRGGPTATGRPGPARQPEEWLGSTVARWGDGRAGLTDLGPLGHLRDLVVGDPPAWLGADHVARWGSSPALLVKLLDAGERLPVHVHPTRAFAAEHLDCPFGKSEAWVVLDTPAGGGTVFIGPTRPVAHEEWADLVAAQDTATMLGLLHPVTVHAGDGVFVPAGTPHAIDAGVFVVELQEPTDFSVVLEWTGFDLDGSNDGHLGLGFDVALGAVRRDAVDCATIDTLIRRAAHHTDTQVPDAATSGRRARSVLPDVADPYFRAWSVAGGPVTLPAAFSVVVVLSGAGVMRTGAHVEPLSRGDAFVVPHGAGDLTLDGTTVAVVAQPPAPDAPEPVEWEG